MLLYRRGVRHAAALLLTAALASACTSSRPPAPPGAVADVDDSIDVAADTTAPEALATATTGEPEPQNVPDGAGTGDQRGRIPAAKDRSTTASARPAQASGSRAPRAPAAPVFSPSDDRVGLTDTTVRLCAHYRKYVGRILDLDEDDLRVYWRWLNDRGGIHERRVEEHFAEDGGGRLVAQAYEECGGSFVMRGGPGAEAITPMRKIVEADRRGVPYLHFAARADARARRSFSFYPSHETFGRLTGQFVLSRFPGARIAMIYKASDGWDAGRSGFLEAFREAGASLVADVPLSPGDPVVADELAAVHRAGAEVVWAWVEGGDVVQLIKQSNAQRYPMRWVVPYAFNTFIEGLGDDSLRPAPITGLNMTPPATPGHYTGPFARYAEEYRRFEDAYRHYRGKLPRRGLADTLFMKWLEDRQLAQLLEQCGRDCTRNRLVDPLLVGTARALDPLCDFDFRRGQAAGYRASAFEATPADGGPIWTEKTPCAERF